MKRQMHQNPQNEPNQNHKPTSAVQDGWVELAAALRVQLAKVLQNPDLWSKPSDLEAYMSATQDLYWLEHNAALFDKRVELEMKRTRPRDDDDDDDDDNEFDED
jgi:hypothetical protein